MIMQMIKGMKIFRFILNGKFYHRSKANVSVMDSGFLLGDGVWEGIRLYKKLLFTLKTI